MKKAGSSAGHARMRRPAFPDAGKMADPFMSGIASRRYRREEKPSRPSRAALKSPEDALLHGFQEPLDFTRFQVRPSDLVVSDLPVRHDLRLKEAGVFPVRGNRRAGLRGR